MGTGHAYKKQFSFFSTPHLHRYCHGGALRQKRPGRGRRPLACREALHVVFKIDKVRLRGGVRSTRAFQIVQKVIGQYSRKFFVKIEQLSIQNDHIHLLVRTSKRSHFHFFFRVVAGQIAQRFQAEGLFEILGSQRVTDTPHPRVLGPSPEGSKGTGLWRHRPFSRVIKGWKAYKVVRNYIRLNEQEARGKIKYRKERLRGLSSADWRILWV